MIRQISYTNFNLLRRRRRNKKKGVDSTVDSVVRPPALQDQRRSLESKRRAHEQQIAAVRSKLGRSSGANGRRNWGWHVGGIFTQHSCEDTIIDAGSVGDAFVHNCS